MVCGSARFWISKDLWRAEPLECPAQLWTSQVRPKQIEDLRSALEELPGEWGTRENLTIRSLGVEKQGGWMEEPKKKQAPRAYNFVLDPFEYKSEPCYREFQLVPWKMATMPSTSQLGLLFSIPTQFKSIPAEGTPGSMLLTWCLLGELSRRPRKSWPENPGSGLLYIWLHDLVNLFFSVAVSGDSGATVTVEGQRDQSLLSLLHSPRRTDD